MSNSSHLVASLLLLAVLSPMVLSRDYSTYENYNSLTKALNDLSIMYPDYVDVDTLQDRYGVPTPANLDPTDKTEMKTPFAVVTNKRISQNDKPQILFMSSVATIDHIGATSLIEFITFLCENAHSDGWVNTMLNTRVLVVVPAVNVQGYTSITKHENTGDGIFNPYFDFPIHKVTTSSECFRTAAARGISQLYEEFFIQITLVFEAGTAKTITYPWSYTEDYTNIYEKKVYEDLALMLIKASVDMSYTTLDGAESVSGYKTGYQSQVVGETQKGSLMDFTYGWSYLEDVFPGNRPQCNPETYGGSLSILASHFSTHALKSITLTMERVADDFSRGFGTNEKLLDKGVADGLISGFVRACLATTDMTAPHVEIQGVTFEDQNIKIDYDIFGGYEVTQTRVYYTIKSKDQIVQDRPSDPSEAEALYGDKTELTFGFGYWGENQTRFTRTIPRPEADKVVSYTVEVAMDTEWWADLPTGKEPISIYGLLRVKESGTFSKHPHHARFAKHHYSYPNFADNEKGAYRADLLDWTYENEPNYIEFRNCHNSANGDLHFTMKLHHDVTTSSVYILIEHDSFQPVPEPVKGKDISFRVYQYGDIRKCHTSVFGRPLDILPHDPDNVYETFQDYLHDVSLNGGRPIAKAQKWDGETSLKILLPYLEPSDFENYDILQQWLGKTMTLTVGTDPEPTYYGVIEEGRSLGYCNQHLCNGRATQAPAVCTVHDSWDGTSLNLGLMSTLEFYPVKGVTNEFYLSGFIYLPKAKVDSARFKIRGREFDITVTEQMSVFEMLMYGTQQVPHLHFPPIEFESFTKDGYDGPLYHFTEVSRISRTKVNIDANILLGLPISLTILSNGKAFQGICVVGDMNPGYRFDPVVDNGYVRQPDGTLAKETTDSSSKSGGGGHDDCDLEGPLITFFVILFVGSFVGWFFTRRYYKPYISQGGVKTKGDHEQINQGD